MKESSWEENAAQGAKRFQEQKIAGIKYLKNLKIVKTFCEFKVTNDQKKKKPV